MTTSTVDAKKSTKAGLGRWMENVLEECDHASAEFAPDPVHDLRVALRRCRSLADGLMALDPDPAWKQMKKAGKQLFGGLGELRDGHVMEEWIHHFDSLGDPVTTKLLDLLAEREVKLKQHAEQALQEFDRKQWKQWSEALPRKAARLQPGNILFQHLALERWTDAHELHHLALRNRSQVSFHNLRIGIKRLRYTVENFLPEQHAAWGNDLKKLQDLLGEVHDLDVLWSTAQKANAFADESSRSHWHSKILEERNKGIESYRQKMVGTTSLWPVWRQALPSGKELEAAANQRLRRWAAALDPDFSRSNRVMRVSLQVYEGVRFVAGHGKGLNQNSREILRLAAMLHGVGRSKKEKNRHKASYRLIQELRAPIGIDATALQNAAVVARYHRGSLPNARKGPWKALSLDQRKKLAPLAGILRLVTVLDFQTSAQSGGVEVQADDKTVLLRVSGYSPYSPEAEKIAAGRHLLEMACHMPVVIRALRRAPATKNGRRPGAR